jgi:hypothetical protein
VVPVPVPVPVHLWQLVKLVVVVVVLADVVGLGLVVTTGGTNEVVGSIVLELVQGLELGAGGGV